MSITFSLTPSDAAASAVFVEQEPVNRNAGVGTFTHRVLIPAQVNTGETPEFGKVKRVFTQADANDIGGRGSMLALLAGDALRRGREVYVMPIEDASAAVAAEGTIEVTAAPNEAGTIAIGIGGDRVVVGVDEDDAADDVATAIAAAISAKGDLPVTASASTSTVTITAKWAGESGNQLTLEVNPREGDELPDGVELTVTDFADGAEDPSLESALNDIGATWYSEVVSPYITTGPLGELVTWAEGRADPGVKRPALIMAGYTGSREDYQTLLDNYNSEWLSFIPVLGSSRPAMRIAAGAAGAWATWQTDNNARPIKGEIIPGALADDDNDLSYTEQDALIKLGGSYTENLPGGRVAFGDVATTRTETNQGVPTTDWRFALIVPNLQFKINALDLTFRDSPFDQAVVISDEGPAGPTYAIRPKTVKSFAVDLIDQWVNLGLSTDRDTIVENTVAQIDGDNPGRINVLIPDVPSAGLRILAAKLEWAFLTGGNN